MSALVGAPHVPANNQSAEQGLIACAMRDPASAVELSWLSPDMLWLEEHRLAWKAIREVVDTGKPPAKLPPHVLRARIESWGSYCDQTKLFDLWQIADDGNGAESHARLIAESWRAREGTFEVERHLALLRDPKRFNEASRALSERLAELEESGPREDHLLDARQLAEQFLADDTSGEGSGRVVIRPSIPEWGMRMGGGYQAGCVYIMAALPGVGKTIIGVQEAIHAARCGHGAGMLSVEMDRRNLSQRLVSHLSDGEWTPQAKSDAAQALASLPLLIDFTPNHEARGLRRAIASMQRAFKGRYGRQLDLLLIDYAQIIKGQGANETERLTQVSNTVREAAREFDVAIILLSQLSRPKEGQRGGRVTMDRLRGTGAFEQDAFAICMLSPSEETDSNDLPVEAEWVKNRQAANPALALMPLTGVDHLTRHGRQAAFSSPMSREQAACSALAEGFDVGF